MSSVIEIWNMALSYVRAGSVNAVEESSRQAAECRLKYEITRDRCLSEMVWGFNSIIEPLQMLYDRPFNWSYAYKYPVHCLSILKLLGQHEAVDPSTNMVGTTGGLRCERTEHHDIDYRDSIPPVPYEVVNLSGVKAIASNYPGLSIQYASKIIDPNLFPADFTLALSHLLASEIAVSHSHRHQPLGSMMWVAQANPLSE